MDSKGKLGMENLETKQRMAGWITKERRNEGLDPVCDVV
jgi:hypothetical protein